MVAPADAEAIKHYCINPVDSQESSMDKPETIAIVADAPEDVKTVNGFCQMNDSELRAFRAEMGFARTKRIFFS